MPPKIVDAVAEIAADPHSETISVYTNCLRSGSWKDRIHDSGAVPRGSLPTSPPAGEYSLMGIMVLLS